MRTTSKQIAASISLVAGMSGALINDSHAGTGPSTGLDILRLCKQNEWACTWYMDGMAEGIRLGEYNVVMTPAVQTLSQSETLIDSVCFPKGWNAVQVRLVFLKYAEGNPEIMNLPSSNLVNDALKKAWPCK